MPITRNPRASAHRDYDNILSRRQSNISGDARSRWKALVQSYVDQGYGYDKAAKLANKQNPSLRRRVVAMANSRV